jgi:nitrile hydratase
MSNSIHDMGGMHGFGPVEEEPNEPVFHTKWESRVYAMNRAMGPLRLWTIDEGRAAQEALHPAVYTNASYYQRWLLGLEARALQHGLVTEDELAAGKALEENDRPNRIFKAEDAVNLTRASFDREPQGEPVFKAGDKVRTLNINPPGHTRLPRYARDKIGEVEAVRGCHVFPDSVANGKGDDPQWLYTVVFDGQTLWGADAEPGLKISIEAFEPYIEAI